MRTGSVQTRTGRRGLDAAAVGGRRGSGHGSDNWRRNREDFRRGFREVFGGAGARLEDEVGVWVGFNVILGVRH